MPHSDYRRALETPRMATKLCVQAQDTIVEVYTKALKKTRVKNIFSSWRKKNEKKIEIENLEILFLIKKYRIFRFVENLNV